MDCYSSPIAALEQYHPGIYDLVLSDFYMPDLYGDEFLKRLRRMDPRVAFVFLTSNADASTAVELIKRGADDYIQKPVNVNDISFRVKKVITEKERARLLDRYQMERELYNKEQTQLVNWRLMYAGKETRQTEQIIHLLSKTLNQTGGFVWVDLLDSALTALPDGNFALPADLLEMIKTSATEQKRVFEYLTFINELNSLQLHLQKMEQPLFADTVQDLVRKKYEALGAAHSRKWVVDRWDVCPDRHLKVEMAWLEKILHELLVNAIKFSDDTSRISVELVHDPQATPPHLALTVVNDARRTTARKDDGSFIHGVPYEFCEFVFDLFYTIEPYPVYIPEEAWSDGTGLYVCRSLLRKMDGWISIKNGVDYTGENPKTIVQCTVKLPLFSSKE